MTPAWRKRIVTAGLLGACVLGGAWLLAGGLFGGHAKEEWPRGEPTGGTRDTSLVMVTLDAVKCQPVQRVVEAVGTLSGYEEVMLSAKVEGRVRKIFHEVSDRVKPGESLLEIDPTDSEILHKHAEKSLLVELARLGFAEPPGTSIDVAKIPTVAQAKARLENALVRLDRTRKLAGVRANSAEELADRTADTLAAQAEHDTQVLIARSGLATIQMKQQMLAQSKQQLTDTLIRVPTPTQLVPGSEKTGVHYAVVHRAVAEGTYLRTGTEVFKLVIDHALKLRVPIPERYSGDVKVGQKVAVTTSAYPESFPGAVARLTPHVDPVTRTFVAEILIHNEGEKLKSGGFAKATILTRVDAGAITVPLESVISFAGVNKVFLVENGVAKTVPVTLGVQASTWVEIASPPLPKGAAIVTSGQSLMADGTRVTVRDRK